MRTINQMRAACLENCKILIKLPRLRKIYSSAKGSLDFLDYLHMFVFELLIKSPDLKGRWMRQSFPHTPYSPDLAPSH